MEFNLICKNNIYNIQFQHFNRKLNIFLKKLFYFVILHIYRVEEVA